jgi:hypothetical protein
MEMEDQYSSVVSNLENEDRQLVDSYHPFQNTRNIEG